MSFNPPSEMGGTGEAVALPGVPKMKTSDDILKWVRNHNRSKEVSKMDNQSIQHTRWNCTYHIVFIPKWRRKIMYGQNKKDIVEIIKKLCEMKGVQLIEGKVCVDHIHMYVAIPPNILVSGVLRIRRS